MSQKRRTRSAPYGRKKHGEPGITHHPDTGEEDEQPQKQAAVCSFRFSVAEEKASRKYDTAQNGGKTAEDQGVQIIKNEFGEHCVGASEIAVAGQNPLAAEGPLFRPQRQCGASTLLRQVHPQANGTAHAGRFFIVDQLLAIQQKGRAAPEYFQTDGMGAPFQLWDGIHIITEAVGRRRSSCPLVPQRDQLPLVQRPGVDGAVFMLPTAASAAKSRAARSAATVCTCFFISAPCFPLPRFRENPTQTAVFFTIIRCNDINTRTWRGDS